MSQTEPVLTLHQAMSGVPMGCKGEDLTDEQFYAYQGSTSRAREYREVGKTYALTANYSF